MSQSEKVEAEVRRLAYWFGEVPVSRLEISILLAHGRTSDDIYELAADRYTYFAK